MNFWVALGLYSLFIALYWFFVWSIYWDVKEYSVPGDRAPAAARIFFVVVGALTLISFVLLFMLPLKF